MWLGTGDQSTVKRWPFGGNVAVCVGQNSVPAQAKLWSLYPAQCHAVLLCHPRTLLAVHASVGRAVMRLGIGELQLWKKGPLPEMQLLTEMHFPTRVIFLQTPRTLVPSTTRKTAVNVDTDLRQLAISAKVSHFETRVNLEYRVHCALAANCTHEQLQQLPLKLSVAKPESCYAWWVGLLLEDQESKSSMKDQEGKAKIIVLIASTYIYSNKPKDMFYVSCSIATVWGIYLKLKTQQGNYRWSSLALPCSNNQLEALPCSNNQLERFSITCSQTLEAVIKNWYKSINDNLDCSV